MMNSTENIAELEAIFLMAEEDACVSNNGDIEKSVEDQITKKSISERESSIVKGFLEDIAKLDGDIDKDILISRQKNKKLKSIQLTEIENKDNERSIVHNGDTDSSDDEDKRNFLDRKYNDYGQQIKNLLSKEDNERINENFNFTFNKDMKRGNISSNLSINKHILAPGKPAQVKSDIKVDVYTDPVFRIRIINPLISSTSLIDKMSGKLAISMSKVKRHTESGGKDVDWVIAGCIISKSAVKTSQKGAQYSIWVISDLHDDLKTVSLFLFSSAHKDLWKTTQGTVIGVLNPNVLEKRDGSKDEASLSVDNPQKVMIFGQSKDLGVCKSRKRNGDPCTAFVNLNKCEYCIFHVKQEYVQHSKRSELQSTFAGNGLSNLRNKVLGKSEVFYAGQSYTAKPLPKNRKQLIKDKGRLNMLSNLTFNTSSANVRSSNVVNSIQSVNKLNACRVEVSVKQREKDLERLRLLKEYMPEAINHVTKSILTNSDTNFVKKVDITIKRREPVLNNFVPTLKSDRGNNIVDLDSGTRLPKQQNKFNLSALQWVQKNGPIKKLDPTNLRGSTDGKKRILDELHNNQSPKKAKVEESTMSFKSERFKKIMEATSINEHLITRAEDEKREKYFESLEKKEAMEEKMLNTFKLACKAVSCLKCKYTSFSASTKCKEEKHPLKVLDAHKRFYKCQDCGNRTVTLDKIPKYSCKNCQSSHWVKAPMMREKIITNPGNILSIRGDEETFIGSCQNGGNLNLLVPE